MSGAQTPGPWRVARLLTMTGENYPGLGRWWLQIRAGEKFDTVICRVFNDDPDEVKQTARRIVACMNACEGFKTDFIEKIRFDAAVVPSFITMAEQRNELLAAAEKALSECCDLIATPAGDALAEAIDACKGGAA